jgi:hypothetical protein
MNRTELSASTPGDFGILSLRIDADHRAIGGQQIWDDGSDTFACSRWCHG